ncbi:membrane-bound lytic murein transglycosylase D [Mucilaginibacter lappiensis]|uniref:Membrane-bound lytic murein transglycosylase D n=1 Tax=Mucilaginibacter lappiensis TaxID=354630 RepID=A0ABR6PNL7_9SPHI|nr:lytic transglycosylase domain-containing protein [Mucilaginibacter lappiensis]MBB6111365.1 membrane-bound lytic murein transglycosylase D [Mucilaginibacter lappiensis]SIR76286.1 membrane-bound lytic murein transglycosylase D [Mucilaginibacter lappiensis]
MKKLFTLTICFLLLQIVYANASSKSKFQWPNIAQDTILRKAVVQPVGPAPLRGIYERRLDSISKDIPLEYNEYVQSYIDLYMQNRDEMGQVIGLSKYYFPIYEKAFRDAGIPEEIKFLSIVESKLDPNAVSRVGATGPWQFMFTTAKLYGLNMDSYVDERRDPIQATYAAAAYLKDAYQEFGDWLLAIASYNCGKSNVERAVEKAGANDFWSARQYLPSETRGYVPAFIAMNYVMHYFNKHNIVPQACNFSLKTDTVMVKKYVALSSISQALKVNISELAILNPAYRRLIVNGSPALPRRLILPQVPKENYAVLYNVLNGGDAVAPEPKVTYASYADNKPEGKMPSRHRVRKGETLTSIADKYGVEVQDLKVWNHLKSNRAPVGVSIKVNNGDDTSTSAAVSTHAKKVL